MLRRWKLPGFHEAPVNDNTRQAPYYTNHDKSPHFNQLFAAMYDLILCSIPKMGLIAPNPGRSIVEVFDETIPHYGDSAGTAGEERHLVGPELIVYLQWLIYSAPFKSQDQGARGDEHKKYYNTWVVSFKVRWGAYSKKLLKELEKWYHKHPPRMTKGHSKSKVQSQTSMALAVDEGLVLES